MIIYTSGKHTTHSYLYHWVYALIAAMRRHGSQLLCRIKGHWFGM